jgi:hypothetical protein
MGIRDDLRKRARKGFRSLLKRAIDFASEEEQTVQPKSTSKPKTTKSEKVAKEDLPLDVQLELSKKQQKVPKTKTEPPDEPPAIPPSVSTGDNDDDPGSLLQQLAESTTMSNDIVRRLTALGMENQAKEVVSATVGRSPSELDDISALGQLTNIAMQQSQQALNAALDALNMTTGLDAAARELKAKAERLAASASQYAEDVQSKVNALTKKVEEMESKLGFDRVGADSEYDWNRKPVYIGFREDPTEAFDKLVELWQKLSIGVKRRDGLPVGKSPFAPRAHARSSDISRTVKIPLYAFSSPEAFKIWSEDNGFKDGLSIEIDGIIYGTSGLTSIK